MIAPAKFSTCMTRNCGRPAGSARGLCTACYAAAKRMVSRGKATWVELESLGSVREKMNRGPGTVSPFEAAVIEARDKSEAPA